MRGLKGGKGEKVWERVCERKNGSLFMNYAEQ